MSAGPNPFAELKYPVPQSPLETMGQVMGIRNAQQEQQARAQQMQTGQIEQQSAQLQLQQQQQAIKDQQAFRTAMQDPANQGKTISDLADTLANSGSISMAGWQQMKKADIEQRTSLAGLTKDQLANADAAHKQTQTLYNNAMDLPDDQLAANWPAIAQQYNAIPGNEKMPMNPQQPMTKDQLQQFGPMISMHQAYIDEALGRQQKQTELQTAQAGLARTQQETDWYKQHNMVPGVTPETQELASYLWNNPGKTPQDYVLWKAEHSPTMIVQGMSNGSANSPAFQLPGGGGTDWGKVAQKYGMTPAAFDQQAEKYYQTGQLPPIGRGNANVIAMNRDLMSRTAELHPNASLAEGSAEYKANAESLKKLQASFDTVNAFEQTADKNIDMLKGFAQKVPDLGARFANVPVRMFTGNMIGTDNMAAFKTALAPVQAESAKILNSANLSGQLSDSARHELQDIVDGNSTYSALVSSLNVLQQDFKNRHDSYQQQIADIQGRIKGASGSSPAAAAAATVTMRAPNGQTKQVSADQVEHYKSMGAAVVQ